MGEGVRGLFGGRLANDLSGADRPRENPDDGCRRCSLVETATEIVPPSADSNDFPRQAGRQLSSFLARLTT